MDKNDYDYSSWYPPEHYSDNFFQQKSYHVTVAKVLSLLAVTVSLKPH